MGEDTLVGCGDKYVDPAQRHSALVDVACFVYGAGPYKGDFVFSSIEREAARNAILKNLGLDKILDKIR